MRDYSRSYAVVGSFVLAVVVGTVFALAWLRGRSGPTETYTTSFDHVAGIQFGTQVLYQGYRVGQVESIEPAPPEADKRFRLELAIEEGWFIDRGAQISIATGILQATVLNIRGGGVAGRIEPGGEIPSVEGADIFSALTDTAGDVRRLMDEVIRPMLEDVGASVPAILANVRELSEALRDAGTRVADMIDAQNVSRVDNVLANVDAVSSDLSSLTATLRESSANLGTAMESLARVVEENEGDVRSAARDLQYSMESIARHIESVNHNLEATSRNLNEFSRQIRGNPALLLGGRSGADEAE